MMQAGLLITVITLFAAMNLQSENYSFIGMPKNDVEANMKKDYRSFSKDNSIVKQQFNYLKYVNGIQTITWVFYFNDNDICRSVKKLCDYAIYDEILEEMDKKYTTVSQNQWEYTDKFNDTFVITLKEEEWYFTLRETRKED